MAMMQRQELRFYQVAAWEEFVQNTCVPLHIKGVPLQGFEGTISSGSVAGLQLTTVRSVQHQCEHEQRHIVHSGDDCLFSLQLNGTGVLSQDGLQASISAGDIVLYDAARPFSWIFPTAFTQLVLRIPRDMLRYRLPAPSAHVAQRIPCQKGIGKLAYQYLQALFEEIDTLESTTTHGLAEHAVDLLTGVLSEFSRYEPGPRTNLQTLHLHKAYAYIADHIRNSSLSPDHIASALNISVRYLHRLFLPTGMTVSRHILELRLNGCARTLTDPAKNELAISTIAYYWGFDNPAHFSRVFKERFGISAREFRAEHFAASSQGRSIKLEMGSHPPTSQH